MAGIDGMCAVSVNRGGRSSILTSGGILEVLTAWPSKERMVAKLSVVAMPCPACRRRNSCDISRDFLQS